MCSEKKYQSFSELDGSVFGCQTSPHNHYLQILTETGIVGMSFFLILVFSFLNFFYFKINVFNNKYNNLLICLFGSLVITIWPLIPTGNFFSSYLNVFYYLSFGFYFANFEERKQYA